VHEGWRRIIKEKDAGALAVIVSPMLSCEEAYLLGTLARGLDPQAMLAIGPISTEGEDKSFPGGYKLYAEKCPNARGVRRALEMVVGGRTPVLRFEDTLTSLADPACDVATVLLTGNYPDPWTDAALVKALAKKFVVAVDTFSNDLTVKADVLLPGATWAEKAGTFENANHRLQSFHQAIAVIELAKCEGQIALDLMAVMGQRPKCRFDPEAIRREMGGAFVSEVHHPASPLMREPDMEYVEL
jgi:NADH-quinone oxidoreductase subunit G